MLRKITEIELYMVVTILVGVRRIYFGLQKLCGGLSECEINRIVIMVFRSTWRTKQNMESPPIFLFRCDWAPKRFIFLQKLKLIKIYEKTIHWFVKTENRVREYVYAPRMC